MRPQHRVLQRAPSVLVELTSLTDWNAKVTRYSYDANGQMITETPPNGIMGTASYDDAGRLAGIHYANASSNAVEPRKSTGR